MFVALTSANGAPGVSTTALGFALTHRRPCLVVEADPVGSSNVLAGYFRGSVAHTVGLIDLAVGHREGRLREALDASVLQLPDTNTRVLPGLTHAVQADSVAPLWAELGEQLAAIARDNTDVIVDAGRIGALHAPTPLIRQADVIAVLARTSLPALAAVASSIGVLQRDLAATNSAASLGLVLIGDAPYGAKDATHATGLDVIATIADKPSHAAVFSHGAQVNPRFLNNGGYLRSLTKAWKSTETYALTHKPSWVENGGNQ